MQSLNLPPSAPLFVDESARSRLSARLADPRAAPPTGKAAFCVDLVDRRWPRRRIAPVGERREPRRERRSGRARGVADPGRHARPSRQRPCHSPRPAGRQLHGGLAATIRDRARWAAEEMRARMEFGIKCAYAHGVSAIRTHLDSVTLALRGAELCVFFPSCAAPGRIGSICRRSRSRRSTST